MRTASTGGSPPAASADQHVKLTYEDFLHFPDDGKRHELIDGERQSYRLKPVMF